ncbi:MAG: hypothetical protein EA377_13060 [Phycisphaerales bacterium]|nr:MAG: hypothetical protein EA377_13060 [Phycisphaerales bacterium]
MSTFRDYAQLARLSNLPTALSNVLVGLAIGLSVTGEPWPIDTTIRLMIGIACFYIGGMALNDLADVEHDRKHRPERPIPSGRITPRSALVFILGCFTLGVIACFLTSLAAGLASLGLLAAIVLYDLLHHRLAISIVFMGLARGLVYLTAALAITADLPPALIAPMALAITIYIIMVTVVARGEAANRLGRSRRLSMTMILIAIAPALFIFPQQQVEAVILSGLILIGWLVFNQRHLLQHPPRMPAAVMGMLAAICLIDAFYLALLGQRNMATIAMILFIVTILGHRRIAGT